MPLVDVEDVVVEVEVEVLLVVVLLVTPPLPPLEAVAPLPPWPEPASMTAVPPHAPLALATQRLANPAMIEGRKQDVAFMGR